MADNGNTTADYRALADATVQKLLSYECDSEGWRQMKCTDGIKIHIRKSKEFDGGMMKLEYTINTSPEKLLELAFDFDWLKSIDDRLANLEVFEMIDPSERLQLIHSVSGKLLLGLVSPREFVTLVGSRHFPEKNAILLFHTSIEHPKIPVIKERIRAETYASGRFMYKVNGEPNKVRCLEFAQTDAKISIPKIVLETMAPKAATKRLTDFITNVEKRMKEGK
ncbi:stAR-related lipid transfer protein 5-like [Glandiceps talaboti]